MKSKTQTAKDFYLENNFSGALKLASSFSIGLTREEKAVLKRGYEAINFPEFYTQLKKNPEELVEKALSLFVLKFMKG